MDSEKLKSLMRDFKNEKIKWWDLAIHLTSLKHFDEFHSILNRSTLQSILKAYLFVKENRPEWLEKPIDVSHYTVSYLPFISMKLAERKRSDEFDKVTDGVLNGSFTAAEVRKLSKELKGRFVNQTTLNLTDKNLPQASSDEEAILGLLNALDYLIDNNKTPIDQLRDKIGSRCYSTSNRLQCIADAEFNELWNNRKEFTL